MQGHSGSGTLASAGKDETSGKKENLGRDASGRLDKYGTEMTVYRENTNSSGILCLNKEKHFPV